MKLFKVIRLMANAHYDWEEATYVVAETIADVAQSYPKASRIESFSDNVHLLIKLKKDD